MPLDLVAQPNAPVPPDTKYVRLQAVLQPGYQYMLQETSFSQVRQTNRHLPLTGPDWCEFPK